MATCELCSGSGWRIVERVDELLPCGFWVRRRDAHSGAERCPCTVRPQSTAARSKPSAKRVAEVVDAMAAVIPFFPKASNEVAQRVICHQIQKFIATEEQLNWFAMTAMEKLSKYESIPQLRALFQTRYDPADGVYASVELPGYSSGGQGSEAGQYIGASEMESRYIEQETAVRDRQVEQFRVAALLGPLEDAKPFPIPEIRRIPEAKTA